MLILCQCSPLAQQYVLAHWAQRHLICKKNSSNFIETVQSIDLYHLFQAMGMNPVRVSKSKAGKALLTYVIHEAVLRHKNVSVLLCQIPSLQVHGTARQADSIDSRH